MTLLQLASIQPPFLQAPQPVASGSVKINQFLANTSNTSIPLVGVNDGSSISLPGNLFGIYNAAGTQLYSFSPAAFHDASGSPGYLLPVSWYDTANGLIWVIGLQNTTSATTHSVWIGNINVATGAVTVVGSNAGSGIANTSASITSLYSIINGQTTGFTQGLHLERASLSSGDLTLHILPAVQTLFKGGSISFSTVDGSVTKPLTLELMSTTFHAGYPLAAYSYVTQDGLYAVGYSALIQDATSGPFPTRGSNGFGLTIYKLGSGIVPRSCFVDGSNVNSSGPVGIFSGPTISGSPQGAINGSTYLPFYCFGGYILSLLWSASGGGNNVFLRTVWDAWIESVYNKINY